jgi:hypothetical protein
LNIDRPLCKKNVSCIFSGHKITDANEWPLCAMKKLHVGCSKVFVIEEEEKEDKESTRRNKDERKRERMKENVLSRSDNIYKTSVLYF